VKLYAVSKESLLMCRVIFLHLSFYYACIWPYLHSYGDPLIKVKFLKSSIRTPLVLAIRPILSAYAKFCIALELVSHSNLVFLITETRTTLNKVVDSESLYVPMLQY